MTSGNCPYCWEKNSVRDVCGNVPFDVVTALQHPKDSIICVKCGRGMDFFAHPPKKFDLMFDRKGTGPPQKYLGPKISLDVGFDREELLSPDNKRTTRFITSTPKATLKIGDHAFDLPLDQATDAFKNLTTSTNEATASLQSISEALKEIGPPKETHHVIKGPNGNMYVFNPKALEMPEPALDTELPDHPTEAEFRHAYLNTPVIRPEAVVRITDHPDSAGLKATNHQPEPPKPEPEKKGGRVRRTLEI